MLNSDDFRFSACFSASMDFSSVFFSYLELQRYDPDCQQLQDVFRSSGIQKQETSAPPEVEQIAPEKVNWPFLVGEANVFQRGPTRWAQQPVISMGWKNLRFSCCFPEKLLIEAPISPYL